MGETRKVQAEAAVIEAEHIARAKAALAEAQRIEAEGEAAAERIRSFSRSLAVDGFFARKHLDGTVRFEALCLAR